MAGRLDGKVALITGGASGMGEGQALQFSGAGAIVVIADIQDELGVGLADSIGSSGGKAAYRHLDVRDADHWQQLVDGIEAEFGRLDILCNNAGTNLRGVDYDGLALEDYRNIMEVNLTASYVGCRVVGPPMRRAGGGAIVNIGSLGSFKHGGNSAYTISKTGILALTKNTAEAYAKDRTRCNVICPGHVDTPFIRADRPHSRNDWNSSADNPDVYEARLAQTPLGRLVTADDVARAALFLCSDDAAMITGAVIPVDGGTALL